MTEILIPVYKPCLEGNERKYVLECIESTWISAKGHFVNDFEESFANRIGVQHAVSVCNGTVALHLALIALGIGPGDEVIVPTLTYIASVNAITYTGATPVFVDSVYTTWQMDPTEISLNITSHTKAIMVVHLYGQACDMDAIMEIARKHRLFVIEDAAEAFGTHYKDRHVGTIGDIGTFSFFGNKTITTGEGGMVVTNDKTLNERTRHFKGQGLAKYREYWHDVIGYNYRMTNVAAAIGLAQLERADDFILKKRELAERYKSELSDYPITFQVEALDTVHSYWMVCILVEKPEQRDYFREHLSLAGIETRPIFYPVHTMPMYSNRYRRYPIAESLAWRGVSLPSWPSITDDEFSIIISSIICFFNK
jgi:perosamine synthetase